MSEIEMVLSKWREEGMAMFKEGKHEHMHFYGPLIISCREWDGQDLGGSTQILPF